jgi:hypothetical protein
MNMQKFIPIFPNNFITCLVFLGLTTSSTSSADSTQPCFDFNSTVKAPLREAVSLKPKKDNTLSGTLATPKSGLWGSARGEVNKPIQKLYEELLDHYTIKSAKKTKLRVYEQDRPGYNDFHVVMVTLPTPVMDVKWEEEWAYAVTEGSKTAPKTIVISYQKTSGTKYVPHLCGSIVLKSISPTSTDVYLYEEINALGKRSHQETVKGHLGTLATLREIKKASL